MLKTLLILVASIIIIYLVLTITAFYSWCKENQINMFLNSDELLLHLDSGKIQELGEGIGNFAQLMEEELQHGEYEEGYHSLAEYYDPLGYSVWIYMQMGISEVLNQYFTISILAGIAVAIAYIVITSKKMNNILKIAIGYVGVMLIVPPIYMYSWTYRFWGILETYRNSGVPKYFYIGYTAIFVLMYFINYKIGVKMTKDLNQTMNNKS